MGAGVFLISLSQLNDSSLSPYKNIILHYMPVYHLIISIPLNLDCFFCFKVTGKVLEPNATACEQRLHRGLNQGCTLIESPV